MQSNFHWLVVMNEGERRLIQAALEACILNPRMGRKINAWKNLEDREKHRNCIKKLIDNISERQGAFRFLIESEDFIDIEDAFSFYKNVIAPNLSEDLASLGHTLRLRSKSTKLFADFNPGMLNLFTAMIDSVGALPEIPLRRIIIVRYKKDVMEYITEFHRLLDEDDEHYEKRAIKEILNNELHRKKEISQLGLKDFEDSTWKWMWMEKLNIPESKSNYTYSHNYIKYNR